MKSHKHGMCNRTRGKTSTTQLLRTIPDHVLENLMGEELKKELKAEIRKQKKRAALHLRSADEILKGA